MNTESLSATARVASGKGGARKARQGGQLPGVVYRGGADALSITIDPKALNAIFRRTRNPNTLISLDIEGDQRLCLIKDIQRHPVTKVARHVDFYEVDAETPVRVLVPVHTHGVSQGAKIGGTLRVISRVLEIVCKPLDIPSDVTIDITPLQVGDYVKVSEIEPPEGCKIVFTTDFNVVTIIGKRGDLEDELAEDEEEGEDAEDGAESEDEA